jgi:hypothetical protein
VCRIALRNDAGDPPSPIAGCRCEFADEFRTWQSAVVVVRQSSVRRVQKISLNAICTKRGSFDCVSATVPKFAEVTVVLAAGHCTAFAGLNVDAAGQPLVPRRLERLVVERADR